MKKILIIDDSIDNLDITKIILTANNFEVETIFDWKQINSSIQKFAPDVILLDVSLGGADGRIICT